VRLDLVGVENLLHVLQADEGHRVAHSMFSVAVSY
jgi:hypothetical protein